MKYTNIKKGAAGGLLALTLMTAGAPAPKAEAATLQELQAQVQQLLLQLQALQAAAGGGTATCTPFAGDLTTGRTGADVTRLQQFLMQRGHVIPAGATGYFGEQTRQALASYQRANSIAPAVGYFGPITRAKVNAACTVVVTPTNPNPGGTNNGSGSGTTNPSAPTLQGEAEFRDFSLNAGVDSNLEEGDTNRSVAGIEFTVEDGDARVQRIDLVFTPDSANNEKDPWDTFTEVSIWDGRDRIVRVDTSNKSMWRNENRSTGAWTLRISGLDHFLAKDRDARFDVRVALAKSIRGAADGENWTLYVPNNGLRALDASRVAVEIGNNSERVDIAIEAAGTGDELVLRTSEDDPRATTLVLNRSARSGFMPVFAFDIDTDDSINDIEIRRIPVELTVSEATFNTFARDVRLVVDGKTITRKTITDGATGVVTFDVRSNELVIDAGDRVTAVVEVDFKPLSQTLEGATIAGRVVAGNIVAEGADALAGSQLSGTVTGDTHTLKTAGAIVTAQDRAAVVTSVQGSLNDYATYRMVVAVTATNQDVFLPANTNALTYELRDASGAVIEANATAVVSSNAREQGGYFFIPEGQTRTITLDVTYQPQVAMTSARVRLLTLEYAATAVTPNQSWTATPVHQYETSVVTIVD